MEVEYRSGNKAMREYVKQLEEERDRAWRVAKRLYEVSKSDTKRIAELEADKKRYLTAIAQAIIERDSLREALEKYGDHYIDCNFESCDCGLEKVLQEADTK